MFNNLEAMTSNITNKLASALAIQLVYLITDVNKDGDDCGWCAC